MRMLFLVIILVLDVPMVSARTAPKPIQEVRSSLRKLLASLKAMKQTNQTNPDKSSKKRIDKSIDRALIRVRAAIARKEPPVSVHPQDLRRIIRLLRKQRAGYSQLSVLRRHVSGQLLNTHQAVKIVRLFPRGRWRVQATIWLWPRLVDPQRSRILLTAVGNKDMQAKVLRAVEIH